MASFFEGGTIPFLGITPQVLANILGQGLTQIAQDQVNSLVGQTFQGSGKSFLAGPGQVILNNAATNVLNIGLNAILGEEISGVSGIDLSNGQEILASVITPSVTASISEEINRSISNALDTAGPFGPVLSDVATGLASTAFDGILSSLGLGGDPTAAIGAGGALYAGPSRRYPGAQEGDPPSDYGGVAWTLGPVGGDVVFSLQPANQGPQLSGLNALADPSAVTSMSYLNYTGEVPNFAGANFSAGNELKLDSMNLGFTPDADYAKYWSDPTIADAFQNTEFGVQQPEGWTFICAPDDINWDLANASTRVDMFGTNNPPVVAGTKGMRDLKIGNALVEGFTRGVQVEDKVKALETLASYSANNSDGFVSVPVYQFWANQKVYGSSNNEQGYFIIKDINVKEEMRDLTGSTTRAYVDISLTQVPAYQVNSGRDQASKVQTGAKSAFVDQAQKNAQSAQQGSTVNNQANNNGNVKPGNNSGATVPKNTKPATGSKPSDVPKGPPAAKFKPVPLPLT